MRRACRFGRDESGVAALEFVMVAPFLLVLLLGGFEVSRFIIVQQKAEKMAYSVADLATQYEMLTKADIDQVFSATAELMHPYEFEDDGLAILSSVYKDPDDEKQKVRWQCSTDSNLSNESTIGEVNAEATLPGTLLLDDKDNVVASEIYYRFTPVFTTFFVQPFVIHRMAVFRPRLGALTTAPGC